jgi:hypothetical protein
MLMLLFMWEKWKGNLLLLSPMFKYLLSHIHLGPIWEGFFESRLIKKPEKLEKPRLCGFILVVKKTASPLWSSSCEALS